MKKMNPVVHFEMPAENRDRMINFYTNVFGWESQKLGPEMGNYVVVKTTETEKNGFPKKPGIINGGFFEKSKNNEYPRVVIAVDDIKEAMRSVEKAGGKLLKGGAKTGEPDIIPGIGLYCSFLDTEGNRVAILQPSPNM
jgi:predicted enzyme related to lactoylglutathione lyase